MRRHLVPALIMLTQLDGSTVWVEATQVQIIRTRSNECGPGTGAVIRVGTSTLCIREQPEEVRDKIRDAKD